MNSIKAMAVAVFRTFARRQAVLLGRLRPVAIAFVVTRCGSSLSSAHAEARPFDFSQLATEEEDPHQFAFERIPFGVNSAPVPRDAFPDHMLRDALACFHGRWDGDLVPLAAPGIPPGLVTAYADCAREVGVESVAEIYRPSTLGQEIVRSEQLIAAIVACVEPNGYVEEDLPIVRLPTGQRLFDERAIGDDEVGAVVTECLREGAGS